MNKNLLLKIGSYLLAAFIILAPVVVLAQGSFDQGLGRISDQFPNSPLARSRTVPELIRQVINIMLFLAGMIAVVFIIIGGYYYVTSGGNEEQAEKGRNTLVNAVIGIVVIILSYVIINVVSNLVSRGTSGF